MFKAKMQCHWNATLQQLLYRWGAVRALAEGGWDQPRGRGWRGWFGETLWDITEIMDCALGLLQDLRDAMD
jgi:hypothetical protein